MKSLILIVPVICLFQYSVLASELVRVRLFDGEVVTGRLDLPSDLTKIKEVVIFVHGTGPGTYLNRMRSGSIEFNYFDYFAEEFSRRGLAFFVANKRGVDIADEPPFYDKVDREKFRKVFPANSALDIGSSIQTLRKDKRLKNAKFILFGWSEGTVIAAMVAEDRKNKVAGLLLAGYVHETMTEVIRWQNEGESSMVAIRGYLDKNLDDQISREEYEAADATSAAIRSQVFKNATFAQLDLNRDRTIDRADFKKIREKPYGILLEKWKALDEEWIWQNYFRVSINWLNEHSTLEPNKSRMMRLKMPIYVFHGDDDANCNVKWVRDLENRFAEAKKTNLRAFVFKGHDHNLNFMTWVRTKTVPDGIKKIFETADSMNK